MISHLEVMEWNSFIRQLGRAVHIQKEKKSESGGKREGGARKKEKKGGREWERGSERERVGHNRLDESQTEYKTGEKVKGKKVTKRQRVCPKEAEARCLAACVVSK